MRPVSLHDKIIELYTMENSPDIDSVLRCTRNYLKKKHSEKKLIKIVEELKLEHDFKKESIRASNRKNLSTYMDSIMTGRIRECYKNNTMLDIDQLDSIKFKSLMKLMLIYFGYQILYIPPVYSSSIDFVVHRQNTRIAVMTVKTNPYLKLDYRKIQSAKHIANIHNCDKLMFITNSRFDDEVLNSVDNSLTLIDRDKLMPLIKDLINNRREKEKEILMNTDEFNENVLFLEKVIKFPKTKVQITDMKYHAKDKEGIVFQGKLYNTGKKPVKNLSIDLRIFNRNNDCCYKKVVTIIEGFMESGEEVPFEFSFPRIPKTEFKHLCMYEMRLEYKNVFKR